jgi:integrase
VLNPAASVRGERYSVVEGKTPEITVEQARRLLASIALTTIIGLRDRAIIATLCYTAARAGAVTRLRKKDFLDDGTQMLLLFDEKGGKQRAIPCRHDLQLMIRAYLDAGGWSEWDKDAPLFRTVCGPTGELTENAMTGIFICKMVKRRVRDAGLPDRLSPHSFRVAAITDLLRQNVPMEDVQYLCGHSSAATTRLYNRQSREVTRNTVERISI